MRDLGLDLRYAWRSLRATPGFSALAIVTLAAGVGVTTAVYSLLHAMMFRPSNVDGIERIVNINNSRGTSGPMISFSWLDYQDLRASQTVFDAMTAWDRMRGPVSGDGWPAEIAFGEAVDANYFAIHNVRPAAGRLIQPSDEQPGAAPVIVLGDAFWRRRYGADPSVLGRTIKLAGTQMQVVGIAPASFRGVDMPNVLPAAFWIPLGRDAVNMTHITPEDLHDRDHRWIRVKARLAPGRTIDDAVAQVGTIASQVDAVHPLPHPESQRGFRRPTRDGWNVVPAASVHMHESIDRMGVPISYGVLAALAMVLLIACVNIANLLLAKGAGRRVEMATRVAVGASRGRLLRQLLTENGLLCALGGAAGLFVAFALTRVMTMRFDIGRGFTFGFEPRLEPAVLVASLTATALAGLAFGVAPAWRGSRVDIRTAMVETSSRRRRVSIRNMLVFSQLAASIALLAVGAVFLRGFAHFARHDPGFDLSRTAVASFETNFRWRDDREAALRFLHKVRDAARQEPGVSAAAIVSALPIGNPGPRFAWLDTERGDRALAGHERRPVSLITASPDGLRVLGIDLLSGRFFDERDDAAAAPVIVVSAGVARGLFGTPDAIGRKLTYIVQRSRDEADVPPTTATIVGITEDTDAGSLGNREHGLVFLPFTAAPDRNASVAVRTDAAVDAAASSLSVLTRRLDDEIVAHVSTGPRTIAQDGAATRVGAGITGVLGALAFLMAVVGLYGVMSHVVASRTREIGIRMALGAESTRVVRSFIADGVRLVMAGCIAGGLVSYWVTGFLRRLIFGLDAVEPSVMFGVCAALATIALIACWVPARRAARVDPNVALRHL